jgi:xanthine dehydrogenase YagR molybdenum-binding subunit
VGYALHERCRLDRHTGRTLSRNMEDYRVPGIGDVPEVDVLFTEEGFEQVEGGSVGIGEVATIAVPAAIANAVCAATGVRPMRIPIRPPELLEGLR